jgi:tetratricopeptide (TPR) repeat protein
MGMAAAAKRADVLDGDPLQQVNAFYLRRITRMQQGDFDGAEKFRKRAEVLALQARSRQMFTGLTSIELAACTMARDITGIKQCAERIRALAANAPGWMPYMHLAEARIELVCENFENALASFEKALDVVTPHADALYPLHTAWCPATGGKIEALVGLERYENAKRFGEEALALAERLEIGAPVHEIVRSLALAEAKLGDHAAAAKRLEAVIARQLELGITGLLLGASYEARARVAIWASDGAAVEKYARLAAREYRHGQGSPLGARYERLMSEARRTSAGALPGLSDFQSSRVASAIFPRTSATMVVTQAMKGADGAKQRAERALRLLCNARAAESGYLFLFGDRGVRLAASQGPRAPDGLESFIDEYVRRELDESDVATEFVDGDSEPDERTMVFNDSRGATYYPLFLTATMDGATCYAGVFAVALTAAPKALDAELAVALGSHFIQSGDTRAIRV